MTKKHAKLGRPPIPERDRLEVISIRLPAWVTERADEIAATNNLGLTRTHVIRLAVEDGINRVGADLERRSRK